MLRAAELHVCLSKLTLPFRATAPVCDEVAKSVSQLERSQKNSFVGLRAHL
jgi:hypothetical protein